jgi:hypothetical protein
MKKKWVIIIFLLTILSLITSTIGFSAEENKSLLPGSVNDPIITKSYLDENIKQLVTEELSKLNTEQKQSQYLPSESKSNINGVIPSINISIIKLEPGQSLYGGSGTEFIVRTGKTAVFSNDESGVADVTIGKDIIAGQAVELNHMLIVPREGRGIKPDPKNNQEIYVMVRGSYLLTNADGSKVSP